MAFWIIYCIQDTAIVFKPQALLLSSSAVIPLLLKYMEP
jgi:hypothetical protein